MRIHLLAVCASLACGSVSARPLVVERNDALPFQALHLAHAGNELIALERRVEPACPAAQGYAIAARLYTRDSSGQWTFTRVLANECATSGQTVFRVAMTASTAVFSLPAGIRIFERQASGWIEQSRPPAPLRWAQGPFVAIHGGAILAASENCDDFPTELRKVGTWRAVATYAGGLPQGVCASSASMALQEDRMITVYRTGPEDDAPRRIVIWETDDLGRQPVSEFTIPGGNDGEFGEDGDDRVGEFSAIHGNLAIVSNGQEGVLIYRRLNGGWLEGERFENPGRGDYGGVASISITDGHVLMTGGNAYRASGAGYLYRRDTGDVLEHVANFVGNNDRAITWFDLVGTRAMALTGDFGNLPVEFEVPTDYFMNPLEQDDFEGEWQARWSLWPNQPPQITVVSNGNSRVLRQPSVAGDASALYTTEWADQNIGADIRINAFNGADRWVGLSTRGTNADYYYVTLRDTNRISLRKMQFNGGFVELASTTFDVQPGQIVNLRLQSSGSEHSVFVYGQLVLRVHDDSLQWPFGRPGVLMYKASADFDNVVMSPGPLTSHTYSGRETQGGNWFGGPRDFVQEDLAAGDSRWLTGTGAEDQTVQALVTTTQFSPTGSSWVGLVTRYVDSENYYYVTVRRDNQLSMRKLTNGAITVLGTVPFTVPANGTFDLRLDAVRDRLRVFVNGVQRLEHLGATIAKGKAGAMTYRARANFGAYTAYEP